MIPDFDDLPLNWPDEFTCGPCRGETEDGTARHDLCLWSAACVCAEPACTDRLARWEPLP